MAANFQFEKRLERTKTIRKRRASQKKKGSKNQKRAYQKLARLDQKNVNQRTDYQWKVAQQLVRLADVIGHCFRRFEHHRHHRHIAIAAKIAAQRSASCST
jgi:transposase